MPKICGKQIPLLFMTIGEGRRQIYGAVNRLLKISIRAGGQLEKLPESAICLSKNVLESNELLPNLGSRSPFAPPLASYVDKHEKR